MRIGLSGMVAAGLMALAACVAPEESQNAAGEQPEKTLEEAREEALAKIDVAACEAGGGVVRPEGMMGMPRCVTPYGDAGAVCSDASDCEGRCMGDDRVTDYDAPPGEAKGICEANDSPFGCYATIVGGTPDAMLCVD